MQIRDATTPPYNPQQRRHTKYAGMQQQQRYNQLATKQVQQKIRNINEEEPINTQEETEEPIDPEAACFIREMMEDWQNVNFIQSINFSDEKVSDIIKQKEEKFG